VTTPETDVPEYPIHEIAALFPEMSPDDYAALRGDIAERGLQEPIWLYDGQIIDGRHRYWACREVGRKPRFRTWTGGSSLTEFVVSLNLHRRHLNAAQKAVLAADLLPHLEREAEEQRRLLISESRQVETAEIFPPSQEEAKTPLPARAKTSRQSSTRAARVIQGTNERYVTDAKRMKKKAPAVLDLVRSGRMNMPDARKVEKVAPEKQTAVLTAIASGQEVKAAIDEHAPASIDDQWAKKDPIARLMTRLAELPLYEAAACVNNMSGLMAIRPSMELHKDIAESAATWLLEYARLLGERLKPQDADSNIRRMNR